MLLMSSLAVAEPDLYATLGIRHDESQQGVKQAFRKLSLQWHPDKHHTEEDKEKAQAMFIDISAAYATLGDEEKRMMYDEFGDAGASTEAKRGSASEDTADAFFPRTFYSQTTRNAKQAYTDPGHPYHSRENPQAKQAGTDPGHSYYSRETPQAKRAYPNPSQANYARETSYAKQGETSYGKQAYGNPSHAFNERDTSHAKQAYMNTRRVRNAHQTPYAKQAYKSSSEHGSRGMDKDARQSGAFFQPGQPRAPNIVGRDTASYSNRIDAGPHRFGGCVVGTGRDHCGHPQPTNEYLTQRGSARSKPESKGFGRVDSFAQTFPKDKVVFPKS